MTTIFTSHHQYHPAPLGQPTPQSPSPTFFMSRDNAGINPHMMGDKQQSQNTVISSSPINSSFPTPRQYQNSANTIPTPSSSAAGTVPETTTYGLDDDMMDASGEFVHKSGKRRGSISAEDQHDLYRNNDRNTGVKRSRSVEDPATQQQLTGKAPPKVPSLIEMLRQTDVHPLHLFCQQCGYPSFPASTLFAHDVAVLCAS